MHVFLKNIYHRCLSENCLYSVAPKKLRSIGKNSGHEKTEKKCDKAFYSAKGVNNCDFQLFQVFGWTILGFMLAYFRLLSLSSARLSYQFYPSSLPSFQRSRNYFPTENNDADSCSKQLVIQETLFRCQQISKNLKSWKIAHGTQGS